MIEQSTPNFAIPLPYPSNRLEEDVVRLRAALNNIDGLLGLLLDALTNEATERVVHDEAIARAVTYATDQSGQAARSLAAVLRDVAMGAAVGWHWTFIGADPAAPETEVWSKGQTRLRAAHTYANGVVTSTTYAMSDNAGTTWATRGRVDYTYAGGYLTATTWS